MMINVVSLNLLVRRGTRSQLVQHSLTAPTMAMSAYWSMVTLYWSFQNRNHRLPDPTERK